MSIHAITFEFMPLHAITFQYMPLHELGDHIWEKAITSCIRIGAAMIKWKDLPKIFTG